MIWTNDDEQLEGQMSIFDCFKGIVSEPVIREYDLEQMDVAEMVRVVSDLLGVKFNYRLEANQWEYRPKKSVVCTLGFSRFSCDGVGYKAGQRFISCSICMNCGNYMGVSGPYLSVASAVQFFRQQIPRFCGEGASK